MTAPDPATSLRFALRRLAHAPALPGGCPNATAPCRTGDSIGRLPPGPGGGATATTAGNAALFDGIERLTLAEHLAEDPVVAVELGARRRIGMPLAATLVHRRGGLAEPARKARGGGSDHRPAEQGGVR